MKYLASLIALAACGGHARTPATLEPRLVTNVEHSAWYRSPALCGQGPYELVVPAGPVSKWGEQIELRVHAPRGIALHAVALVDGAELERANGTYEGAVDNSRCLADKRERVALGHASGGTEPGTPVQTGTQVPTTTTTTTTAQLELTDQIALDSTPVLSLRLPEHADHIVLRLWSIEPNDLEGVFFGVTKIAYVPNVSEADYEAHLARLEREARERAEQARLRAEREAAEEARKRAAAPPREVVVETPPPRETPAPRPVVVKPPRETPRRYGAELDARKREREQFCATHPDDARCWSSGRWERFRRASQDRLSAALAPAAQPEGPPPAPLAEEVPPKLSAHATWRPGYWHWLDGTWVWLAGMWRVPDEDIVAEQTTTAPAAPPPLQAETPPPPPAPSAVWLAGFWQWNGTSWVWIAGSYQLRPAGSVTWRAPEWRPRGSVHILVPGGWIRGGRR